MFFKDVVWTPDDPILGLFDIFKKDPRQDKVNLIVGVYKDAEGNTPILESVKLAEKYLFENEKSKAYLGISGSVEYCELVKRLVLGNDHDLIKEGCVEAIQTPGGSGALRLAADFLYENNPKAKIHLSDPTWDNHANVFHHAGLEIAYYPYYDTETKGIKFDELISYLKKVPNGDVVLFHACCHNPTGTDLNEEQWKEISRLSSKKKFLVFFDFAYQGMGDSMEEDSFAIRIFAEENRAFMAAYSCSKNFAIYNERTGALVISAEKPEHARNVMSQLKLCARGNYSNPPSHGAAVVTTVLKIPEIRSLWKQELIAMCGRIKTYRQIFVDTLKNYGSKRDFSFITKQKGMFSYSSLSHEQVMKLREDYGVYMLLSGRINIASLNHHNLDRVCTSIVDVLSDGEG
ncbi:MAG TPA: aromatic amino acid aminotransferase [Lentisphaeria bacterium]|nr:MAG: aromatic amino acid aminotransferase [Lentisphaerae bacterium GWF2_38_69]HBM16156.1 aromatic amino acid aminotransferase [Lentisphaeria bacterium]